jgi:hypothetical protein
VLPQAEKRTSEEESMVTSTTSAVEPARGGGRSLRRLGRPALALVLVGLLFFLLQHVLLPRPFGFSTDEVTYLAKVDPTAPELYWTEPRAWGVPVLAAPIAVFSPGIELVRLYFSVLSSAALVAAFWPWLRVLHPAVAPLGALLFSTSWFALFFGPQVMPNLYVGLGAVAIVGLFLRAVREPSWQRLALTGATVAVVALIRPTDSVLVVAPVVAIALFVPRLRRPVVLGVLVVGGVVGWLPWIVEAFVRFGDPFTRLSAAEDAGPKGLGLDLEYLLALPRFIDGSPYYITADEPDGGGPVNLPLTVWLLAVVVLVGLGLGAARAERRLPELLLVFVPACVLAAFYLLLPSFTSIRFLVPVFALLGVLVATALVHAVTTAGTRRRAISGVIAVGLLLHAAMMVYGAYRNLHGQAVARAELLQAAQALRPLVERERCLVVGQEPQATAYYLGCTVQQARPQETPQWPVSDAIENGWDVVAVLHTPVDEGYLTTWRPIDVPGLPDGWQAFRPPDQTD